MKLIFCKQFHYYSNVEGECSHKIELEWRNGSLYCDTECSGKTFVFNNN